MVELIDRLASAAHSYSPSEEDADLGDELLGYVGSMTRVLRV